MKFTKYLDADKKFNLIGALGTILYFLGVPQFLGAVLCATKAFLLF